MSLFDEKMNELVSLMEKYAIVEGFNETAIPDLIIYKESGLHDRNMIVHEQGLAILGQGRKNCYLDGQKIDYCIGNYLAMFLPMPVEIEVVEASVEEPLLMVGIRIDLARIAGILLKMEKVVKRTPRTDADNLSSIIANPLNDQMLDLILKLLHMLENPLEVSVLADAVLDEIYFRLINDDSSGNLYRGLQHHGQMQEISRAVTHIHENLSQAISVEELASMANMSTANFRKIFREIMHMPPLQYAKRIKLDRAHRFIQEGKKAIEAGYLVGYNSPAQFSREYKRHFGYAPSVT